YTGTVLDLKELIDAANKENVRTLFVVDGSQAVGNIMVSDDALVRSAYYAFQGHGWLLGTQSSGILVRNAWLLRVIAGIRQAAPTGRPFASFRQAYSEFFFFQAEDGIRDRNVTGVQTCALPI